jgi:1,4-alpha-glucan branching enzyme
MGQEFAQWDEWDAERELDWHLLTGAPHAGMQKLIGDLNAVYRATPALHARDCEGDGFEWLIADDAKNSVFAWVRKAGDAPPAVVVSNFTPVPRDGYVVPMPLAGRWHEAINTDAADYWGSGRGNLGGVVAAARGSHGKPASAEVSLPPLATLIFTYEG